MIKAPPTVLTPETLGLSFLVWLASIGATSFFMHLGKVGEGWMFVVMSWPLVLGVAVVAVERTIYRLRGGDPNLLPGGAPAAAGAERSASAAPPAGDRPGLAKAS
jgi:hypothetical protein